jgi:4-hydroxy-3-polyprenylbenzoate decarboxylase
MAELAYRDFRSFIEEAKKLSDYRLIEGADWDGEIGALVESTAELVPQPPMLIFDRVKGYPAGFRVCSLPYAAYKRVALALGLPIDKPKLEILRLAARKIQSSKPIPTKEIAALRKQVKQASQSAQVPSATFS